jgi:hypothetical protein
MCNYIKLAHNTNKKAFVIRFHTAHFMTLPVLGDQKIRPSALPFQRFFVFTRMVLYVAISRTYTYNLGRELVLTLEVVSLYVA